MCVYILSVYLAFAMAQLGSQLLMLLFVHVYKASSIEPIVINMVEKNVSQL